MNVNELYKNLLALLEQKSSKYADDPRKQMLYEKGFLLGLLLRLASKDIFTASELLSLIHI